MDYEQWLEAFPPKREAICRDCGWFDDDLEEPFCTAWLKDKSGNMPTLPYIWPDQLSQCPYGKWNEADYPNLGC